MWETRSLVALLAASLAVLFLLGSPGDAPAAREAPSVEISPLLVLSGTDGHVREREYHCIRDAKAWAALWRRNSGLEKGHFNGHDYNKWIVGVPMVNFEECMVIAVFKGAGSHTGVRGEWITKEEDVLRFRFLAAWQRDPMFPQPPPESPTGPSMPPREDFVEIPEDPVPYDFFVLPRSDRLVIVEEMIHRKASPTKYVERARFR